MGGKALVVAGNTTFFSRTSADALATAAPKRDEPIMMETMNVAKIHPNGRSRASCWVIPRCSVGVQINTNEYMALSKNDWMAPIERIFISVPKKSSGGSFFSLQHTLFAGLDAGLEGGEPVFAPFLSIVFVPKLADNESADGEQNQGEHERRHQACCATQTNDVNKSIWYIYTPKTSTIKLATTPDAIAIRLLDHVAHENVWEIRSEGKANKKKKVVFFRCC